MSVKPPIPTGGQPAEPDDGQLARRVAQGDREAAAALIERYQGPVRAFLFRLTGGHADLADDLAQETFIKMLRNAARFDPQYAMMTWLMTIARRLWLNHLRRHGNRMTSTEYHQMEGRPDDPAAQVELEDSQRHARELLDSAMSELTDAQRAVVLMYHQQELSIAEVARAMDMPEGTVKSHLHRARAAMRRILQPRMEVFEP
jgi:RNA polymerase sigma-70 factor (ECF subfamily)